MSRPVLTTYDHAIRHEELVAARATVAELIVELQNMDEAYCDLHPDMTAKARLEGRKTLIAARAALARARGEPATLDELIEAQSREAKRDAALRAKLDALIRRLEHGDVIALQLAVEIRSCLT